jgi:hypothetical protein
MSPGPAVSAIRRALRSPRSAPMQRTIPRGEATASRQTRDPHQQGGRAGLDGSVADLAGVAGGATAEVAVQDEAGADAVGHVDGQQRARGLTKG